MTIGEYSEKTLATTSNPDNQPKNSLGIEVSNITPEIAQQLGLGNTAEQGVVITRVDPSSVASWAGLKKGALILGINRQKITNVDEFHRLIAEAPKDQPILLQIKQGDAYLFLSLQNKEIGE